MISQTEYDAANDDRITVLKDGQMMTFADASLAVRNERTVKAISDGMCRVMASVSGSDGKSRAAEAYAKAVAVAIESKEGK